MSSDTKSKKAETKPSNKVTAVCKCGAKNTAPVKSRAIDGIIHNDGCDCDLARWEGWIKTS